MNIFVSSLSYSTTDQDLKQLFDSYGNVSSAKVIMDRDTNRSKGFGFVEMGNDEEGQEAIKQLDGSRFDGRSISVSVARPREEKSGNKRSFAGNSRW